MLIVFWIAGVLPVLIAVLASIWGVSIYPGGEKKTIADIWSVSGVVLGYYGVLFSGYAAFQVKSLSDKYFARTRFPEIRENLDAITKKMAIPGGKVAADIRSEDFIAIISSSLNAVRRIRGHQLGELIDRATEEKAVLLKWINSDLNQMELVRKRSEYWDLFQTIQEISQEISSHMKDQVAR